MTKRKEDEGDSIPVLRGGSNYSQKPPLGGCPCAVVPEMIFYLLVLAGGAGVLIGGLMWLGVIGGLEGIGLLLALPVSILACAIGIFAMGVLYMNPLWVSLVLCLVMLGIMYLARPYLIVFGGM